MERTNVKALLERREKQAGETDKPKRKDKKKSRLKLITAMLVPAIVTIVMMLQRRQAVRTVAAEANAVNTTTAETRDTVSELSSSGTLLAKDSYSITALAEGEVIGADFGGGDQVEKRQVPYETDRISVESQSSNAKNSLERSQKDYEKAVQKYNKILSGYSGNTYKATETGHISELNTSVGSEVSNSTIIAKPCSDGVMKVRILFLFGEATLTAPGVGAVLTLVNTGGQVADTVTAITNQEVALTGGRVTHNITIQAANSDGLITSTRAVAQIGEFVGSEDSTLMITIDITMNAELSATVEVVSSLMGEGDRVTVGTPVFLTTTKTAGDLIETYSDAMEDTEEKVESARSSLGNTQDTRDDYTITASMSGQTIAKSYKMGDNIPRNISNTTTVATIYDLSGPTSGMSIDELDTLSVKVGQKVAVTADAPEGEAYTGAVTNIGLESTYFNGVTTYLVTVTMDEMGDLLPEIDAGRVITLDKAVGVLAVLSDTLVRGNQVYMKDDTVIQQADPVPIGFWAVEVEIGPVSDSCVKIKGGLSEGDAVYMAGTSTSNTSVSMMGMEGGSGGDGGRDNKGGQGGPGGGGGRGDGLG